MKDGFAGDVTQSKIPAAVLAGGKPDSFDGLNQIEFAQPKQFAGWNPFLAVLAGGLLN